MTFSPAIHKRFLVLPRRNPEFLAIGASPVMADVPEEAADMAKLADAVVLNLGNLVRADLEAMILAGKTANEQGKPVVLDPVGVGSTPFRLVTAEKLLGEFKADIIRGNAAEIANLIGERWEVKGVDAGSGGGNAVEVTEKAAQKLDMTISLKPAWSSPISVPS